MTRIWHRPDYLSLEGQFVTLLPLDPDRHAPALWAAGHGDGAREAIWHYLPYGPFTNADEMRNWMTSRMMPRADHLTWTVSRAKVESPVGMVSLSPVVAEHGRAEIGHVWMSVDVQRSKVNTETQFLLLSHLFDTCGYRRAEWKCNADNVPSRHAAARMGFRFEGRFHQHMWIKGRNRDSDWFALTDKDWPRVRANFRTWLYEDDSVPLDVLNSG